MKALILAGGMGTRLRPLTLSTPKPLVPLLDRPLVMHIINALPREVDTVVLAVSYMKDELERYFREHDCRRQVVLVYEEEPLGTGGAIRNVRHLLDGTFICFNGDIVSSIDLSSFLSFHRSKGGIGTLALWRVPDPSPFGVVGLRDDRIIDFQEKPAPDQALSGIINAGTYVFEPELLDHIGEGVVSLERTVFPHILERGLYGYIFEGHWVDCGTPESYLRAQSVLIEQRPLVNPSLSDRVELTGRNFIDRATLIGCRIGPHVCAMPGSAVGEGSTLVCSTLMQGAQVGRDCRVRDSIIGPGARVSDGAAVVGQVLVG